MPDSGAGGINDASSGGITGTHADADLLPILVGPSTEDQKNVIHLPLVSVACWGVDDIRFAFDSSFLNVDYDGNEDPPEDIRQELITLKTLVEANKGCPLALFGHADPVGNDDYNKKLSERRARSVYALLIYKSEPSLAVQYWNQISSTENWGSDQQSTMQSFVSQGGSQTGGQTGSSLIDSYLKKLSEPGPQLSKTDFLAQGAGADRKGDFQGCSEFNPLIIFSQEKQAEFDQAKADNDTAGIADRNAQNAPSRRVLGLFFRKGSKIEPTKWPCPRASAGIGDCKNQFWSNGETRRSTHLPNWVDRKFEDAYDTFACRFYQRLVGASPCEGSPGLLHISNILFLNYPANPLQNKPFKLYLNDRVVNGNTGTDGYLHQEKVPAGDYRVEVANCVTYVSAIPLSMNRLPWLLNIDSANGQSDGTQSACIDPQKPATGSAVSSGGTP